jgi:hypothetical protein
MNQAPGPHPYKALHRHQYWFIDGRRMDFALDGVRWWSLIMLEGYSRTMLAGAMAPSEATWAALMVLYTACRRYGAPGTLVSDSGGAYTSHDFEAVCTRLQVQPVDVLGAAKGRLYAEDELAHCFSQALFPRITNRYGCVTLHSYHFYVEAGIPQTQVLLWVAGEQLRAVFEHVILAEYHCRYDWQDRKVKDIREGMRYQTRFAFPQGALIPLTPQECLVVYRAKRPRRQAPHSARAQQLLLFEFIATG